MSDGHDDTVRPVWRNRDGAKTKPGPGAKTKPGPGAFLSVLVSASTVAALGVFCALCYPIIKELRDERVRAEDGTEHRMLGFWSILVLSLLGGFISCTLSWTLTYLDVTFPTKLTLHHLRDDPDPLITYGVSLLNGVMAALTVVWSLC